MSNNSASEATCREEKMTWGSALMNHTYKTAKWFVDIPGEVYMGSKDDTPGVFSITPWPVKSAP
ncbi:hypothetical protein OS493_000120 [Desmophyllum pertusum]|uniref:Uncharacterized protein n=1 Tax=Desmophyllum pertusum TaxID=174260 RepID=A0A9X0DBD6_9CNID|nr:hypothetical protein OS493_000120 [Desmophyllum pertusum]